MFLTKVDTERITLKPAIVFYVWQEGDQKYQKYS